MRGIDADVVTAENTIVVGGSRTTLRWDSAFVFDGRPNKQVGNILRGAVSFMKKTGRWAQMRMLPQ